MSKKKAKGGVSQRRYASKVVSPTTVVEWSASSCAVIAPMQKSKAAKPTVIDGGSRRRSTTEGHEVDGARTRNSAEPKAT